jgi:hypothetical protein
MYIQQFLKRTSPRIYRPIHFVLVANDSGMGTLLIWHSVVERATTVQESRAAGILWIENS